ncbi:MAG: hypothetical protein V5B44_05410 [Candidatus Accumulibacter necessarius]
MGPRRRSRSCAAACSASINDKLAAESVCRAFADYLHGNSDDFPHETQESRYFDR